MKTKEQIQDSIDLTRKFLRKEGDAVVAAQAALDEALSIRNQRVRMLADLELMLHERIVKDNANRNRLCREKAKRLSKQYDIVIEDDSERDRTGYYLRHYVGQPRWLKGQDPIDDGHYSHDWSETLWLVEFYAKHHPNHPDHANRERGVVSPHC